MKLFNSFTGDITKLNSKSVTIYTCGPTVYDYIHIGNARPLILTDTLIRYLDYKNIDYNYLLNITDIDDKIINKANQLNITEEDLVNKYKKAFLEDMNNLNLLSPTNIISISSKIDEIIFFIDALIEKGHAYESNGSVYFDISSIEEEYGKLSKQEIDNLLNGVRFDNDINKKNAFDFVLWKKTKVGKKWLSKWGLGRPGWHTECALLIDNYFKNTIDIHVGGIDLKFPHHENERIQFIAKNNIELARFWIYNGHLTLNNLKMSKSFGNIINVKDFLTNYDPNVLRYIFLSSSYRQPLNITDTSINQAVEWNKKLHNLLKTVNWKLAIKEVFENNKTPIDEDFNPLNFLEKFSNYMDDDLNTPMVITLVDDLIKNINKQLKSGYLDLCINELKEIIKCLGFSFDLLELTTDDIKLLNLWKQAKLDKDYDRADKLRQTLLERNIF
ncbi:cysteinyl-tRNA synthetase [Spiroplasma corruscae]|uniref:Cysteine--tRNA ligase n=1 Tax=Spiroplasma corruscae TaxID=216934 RepID=A0A222END3_9MOLU|nr:cysteine--tRNA ligase [Spiroplasma corruscae]ASP27804.1 cysteinyl-tRNA synthetase [Spiroplasma corruscae]